MMKRKIFTFLLVLGVAWSLHSCDNNDDESIAVPVELQSTFSAKCHKRRMGKQVRILRSRFL